jgi:hypothetical protein
MEYLVIAVCTTGLLAVVAILARNALRRNWDVLSWRNLFLVGYAHFVFLSGYFTASHGRGVIRQGAVTDYTMALYAVLAPLFFVLFLGCAALARNKGLFQRMIPRLELPVTTPAILVSIVVLLTLAVGCMVAPLPKYLLLLAYQFQAGLAITAVGLATYWWLANRFNPASWALLLGTIGLGILLCTAGGIGRRDAVAALIAVPWMWYFATLRYRSAVSMALPVAGLAVAGVLFIAAYTVVRAQGVKEHQGAGVSQRLQQFTNLATNPEISDDAVQNMLYTDTAGNTMFIFKNYPANYEYTPFRSLWWMVVNPVPRSIYPSKPDALGIVLQKQMGVEANLGPGVLGQGWSEGGAVAVVIFAVFLGLLYGAMDRALFDRAWNPFFVAVAGSSAGNVLAMPRGDVALFLIQVFAAMVASAAVLALVNLVVGPIARAFPVLSVAPPTVAEGAEGDSELGEQAEPPGNEGHAPKYVLVLPNEGGQ